MTEREEGAVFVEAPARLHFGMLDLRGGLGRRFGGIGVAIPSPSLLLEASPDDTLHADGPSGERACEFGRRFMEHHGLQGGAYIRVHRAIPSHAGLGSGTQLALAVARALAELYSLPTDAPLLAKAVGRARRSAIGTWIFAKGGFVLEGGRRKGDRDPAPLLARYALPANWRYVAAIPPGKVGMSGEKEAAAFARLPPPPERGVMRVSHLVLMSLLPALVEKDLHAFGHALTEIQCINGRWFAPAQGGAFSPGLSNTLVERMSEWGAAGVGQSSWGPAVYGIVGGDEAADLLAARTRQEIGVGGTEKNGGGEAGMVYTGAFSNGGARVWRG
jgi:beta-ribofuranosylaminobenzene 5'-phosphate synthase